MKIDLENAKKIETGFKTPTNYWDDKAVFLFEIATKKQSNIIFLNNTFFKVAASIIIVGIIILLWQNSSADENEKTDNVLVYMANQDIYIQEIASHLTDQDFIVLSEELNLKTDDVEAYLENENIESYLQ